jgi:hypothetical protein
VVFGGAAFTGEMGIQSANEAFLLFDQPPADLITLEIINTINYPLNFSLTSVAAWKAPVPWLAAILERWCNVDCCADLLDPCKHSILAVCAQQELLGLQS